MGKVESLSMLNTEGGFLALKEKYNGMIEDVQKESITNLIKNKELSGEVTSGSVVAHRLVTAEPKDYGTARASGKGEKIEGSEITILVNDYKEFIAEIDEFDVVGTPVDDVVNRKIDDQKLSLQADLDEKFWNATVGYAEGIFTTTETSIEKQVEKLIQKVEKTKNKYIRNGVPRNRIVLVLDPETYGDLDTKINTLPSAAGSTAGQVELFHNVRVYSAILPAGVKAIAMALGSVAQPYYIKEMKPGQIDLSNAYGFGFFYKNKAQVVQPDLIHVYTNGTLTITSAAGAASGKTAITLDETPYAGAKLYFKTASNVTAPAVGTAVDTDAFTVWDGKADITATNGHKIAVVEVNPYGKITRVSNVATVVSAS